MVVVVNFYVFWIGKNIIENGGNVIDVVVVIQVMLMLVELQLFGVGGGVFMLYWDNEIKILYIFDGCEMVFVGVNVYWFMEYGQFMKWIDVVVGGKLVGVLGVMKVLEIVYIKYGELEWKVLFVDVIVILEEGFKVFKCFEKLVIMVEQYYKGMKVFLLIVIYFYFVGKLLKVGMIKKNLLLGKILCNIVEQGIDYMYKGDLVIKIVKVV